MLTGFSAPSTIYKGDAPSDDPLGIDMGCKREQCEDLKSTLMLMPEKRLCGKYGLILC